MRKFLFMTRYSDRTDTTSAAIREFASTLRLVATHFEYQADAVDSHRLEKVSVAYWKSVRNTLDGLGKFAGSIQEAITEATVLNKFDAMVGEEASETPPQKEKPKPNHKKKST